MPAPDAESAELARVRRQHGGSSLALPPAVHRGERAQRLGVEHERRSLLPARVEQHPNEIGGRETWSQAGADHQRVMVVVEDPCERGLRIELLDVVFGQRHRRRLDDLRGEQRLERLGHGQRDEAHTSAAGGAAHEQGGPGVVERSREHEQLAERALVAALRAFRQERDRGLLVELGNALRPGPLVGRTGVARADAICPSSEPDRPPLGHGSPPTGSGASDASAAAPLVSARSRSRSMRARIRRSRSSSRSSISGGKR